MGAQTESEQSYTERTATAVRDLSDWFDTKYARPGLGLVQQAWATRPGLTTFLVLFGALSIVPILMFLLFAVVVSATFIVVGLGTAVVAAVAVIAFTGSFLICLLLFLVFVAAGLTAIAISSLFAFQLFGSVDLNGLREGGTQMLDDTRGRLFSKNAQPSSDQIQKNKDESSTESLIPYKDEFVAVSKEQN